MNRCNFVINGYDRLEIVGWFLWGLSGMILPLVASSRLFIVGDMIILLVVPAIAMFFLSYQQEDFVMEGFAALGLFIGILLGFFMPAPITVLAVALAAALGIPLGFGGMFKRSYGMFPFNLFSGAR